MAGYVLVLAMLLLGGVIATIGDRLGTKVGKARLSLWGMRPRKTAVAITIMTGGVISATTLGILFTFSEQLRTGVFELESLQRKLRQARTELEETESERQTIERERNQARSEQVIVERRLTETRGSLEGALVRQKQTEAQLKQVADRAVQIRTEAERLQREQEVLIQQRDEVVTQIAQRNQEIERRNQEIARRDLEVAQRDREISQQEARLSQQDQRISSQGEAIEQQKAELERQQTDLQKQRSELSDRDEEIITQRKIVEEGKQQIAQDKQRIRELDDDILLREQELLDLEGELRQLRQGNVVITRGTSLATRIVRILVPSAAEQAIDLLLQEANKAALERISPGVETNSEEPTIKITQAEVDRLRREIEDGREYVIRILSARNYVAGEREVLVFTDVVPNQIIFEENIILATASVSPDTMDASVIQERISLLVEASRFRARRAGMVSQRTLIGNEPFANLVQFYEQLQAEESRVSLKAVTAAPVYTAGPLRMNLVAMRNGEELFRTGDSEEFDESELSGDELEEQ